MQRHFVFGKGKSFYIAPKNSEWVLDYLKKAQEEKFFSMIDPVFRPCTDRTRGPFYRIPNHRFLWKMQDAARLHGVKLSIFEILATPNGECLAPVDINFTEGSAFGDRQVTPARAMQTA